MKLLGLCGLLFVTNIYASDSILLNCNDTGTYPNAKAIKLNGDGNFSFDNTTNTLQSLSYTLTICSPVNECKSITASGTSIPNRTYISPPIGITMRSHFTKYGSYYYKVKLEVHSYKNFERTKSCVVRFA